MPYWKEAIPVHTIFGIKLPYSSGEKNVYEKRLTHSDGRQPIAIGHLRNQGDLEITPGIIMLI